MVLPLQVTFRGVEHSETIEGWIREEAAKLDEFYDHIMACRVLVELVNRRHKSGSLYHLRIDLTVPGGELIVKREPNLHGSMQDIGEERNAKCLETNIPHRDLRQAIDDAFKAMGRRLEDYARRQRGDVKTHERTPRASVSKLLPAEGYGFLKTPDGREVYFHRNSVLDHGFDRLEIGTAVRFIEEPGQKGAQASTVRVNQKRRAAGTHRERLDKPACCTG